MSVEFSDLLAFRVKLANAVEKDNSCFEPALIAVAAAPGNKSFNEMHAFVPVWTMGFNDLPENETVRCLQCDRVGLQTSFFSTITCMSTVLPELVF